MDEIYNGYNQMEADVSRITQQTNEFLNQVRREIEGYKRSLDDMGSLNRSVTKDAPLVISFVGKFKTGKSSLINALLGDDILPTRATTATAVVTRIFRGSRKEAWVRENGREESVSIEKAQEMILNHQVEDIENPTEIIIKAPISWLSKDVELRDTPGMDDDAQNGALEAVTLKALKDTDVCICVYDASSMLSEKERERTVKIHRQMGGNVVYTINCTNRLNSIERIQEVENFSHSFFGSFESEINGMGKVYMMCSAPGMVDLDGFDEWLKELAKSDFLFSRKSRSFRSNIRSISISAQIMDKRIEISESAKSEIESLQNLRRKLCNIQEDAKKTKIKKAKERGEKQSAKIRDIAAEAEEILINIDNLRSEIAPLASGEDWKDEYSSKTKNAVRQYFEKNFADIRKRWNSYFTAGDESFVRNVTEAADFPGSHVAFVPATSDEKWGWTGAGVGIGALLGGPIGAAIGGAIGRAIGGIDTTTDDSVDNTMSFVRTNIIPQLIVAFEALVNKAAERARKKIVSDAESESVGYERYIMEVNYLLDDLKKFVIR